jgi:hypothetical protein
MTQARRGQADSTAAPGALGWSRAECRSAGALRYWVPLTAASQNFWMGG